jgi:methylmalonyl-CoA/ethylmalonyl-CoA epimerase
MSDFALSTIGQIAIAVRDLPRAVEFYRDKLGIQFLSQSSTMAFFDCDGIRLLLGPLQGDHPASSLVYFKVDDIAAAAAALKSRGVGLERDPHFVAHMPGHDLWLAFLRDPDGNTIGLMCEKK